MNIDDMADLIDVYNAVQELGAVVAEVYEASVHGLFSDSIYGRLLILQMIKHWCSWVIRGKIKFPTKVRLNKNKLPMFAVMNVRH